VFDVLLPLLSVAVVIAPLMFTVDAIAKTPLSKLSVAKPRRFPGSFLMRRWSIASQMQRLINSWLRAGAIRMGIECDVDDLNPPPEYPSVPSDKDSGRTK
jgi:hypothetical protein